MAYTKITKDMNIIAALDDEPNDVGGLTASELKAKFDEGGLAVKTSFNGLCDELDASAAGTTATKTEVDQLHEAGAVKADFEKLHAITASASDINNAVADKVKLFSMSSTSDLVTAQSAYDWYKAGKIPILYLANWVFFYPYAQSGNNLYFYNSQRLYVQRDNMNGTTNVKDGGFIYFVVSGNTVTSVFDSGTNLSLFKIVEPGSSYYINAFTPTRDGDPATKKYVDEHIAPGFTYTTTAPTAENTNGIKVCVLSSEPATKYSGWLYLITE